MTMDRTRSNVLAKLRAADVHGRFHAYCPFTRRGAECIIVHSKVAIIDDRLLRAGSTNLNNRSAGFDSECDVAVEPWPEDHAARAAIERFRSRLVAHYLGCPPEDFARTHREIGSLAGAIEALDIGERRRLRPLRPVPLGPLSRLIAAFHLGDPAAPADSWRPWRRRITIERERLAFAQDLREAASAHHRLDFDHPPARRRLRAR